MNSAWKERAETIAKQEGAIRILISKLLGIGENTVF